MGSCPQQKICPPCACYAWVTQGQVSLGLNGMGYPLSKGGMSAKIVRLSVVSGLALGIVQYPWISLAQESPEKPQTSSSVTAEPPSAAKEVRLPWLSKGVTVGLALSLQLGKPLYLGSGRQDSLETTAVPFFQFNPMFWFQKERGRQCLREPEQTGIVPCLAHRFGVVLGRPLSYEAKTSIPKEPTLIAVRTVRPQAALGLSYSLMPELSVMSGWMFARVTRQDGGGAKLGTLWIALGGTIDFLR